MRIGIDGGCLANRRGFGRFARKVVESLALADSAHQFVVFLDAPSRESVRIPSRFETAVVDVREAPSVAASASGRRGVRDLLAMGRAASKARLDLLYFPATYSFFPAWNCGKLVVTMHDTLALAHPEWVFPTWKGRLAWKLKEHVAVRMADRVVTVSESARRDLIGWFGLDAGKVRVVSEGPDDAFRPTEDGAESAAILAKYGVEAGSRYLLYVGGLSPHKNLSRLIEAFARAAPEDVALILVGDLGDVFHTHVPQLRELIARLGAGDRVRFAGFVPDGELAHLYGRAYALVQPSLMEGFGLPPVEALACGTPVLSSLAGSLPEVIGEAGVFFEPTDVDAMAGVIRDFLADPVARERLAGLARKRASRYTWAASARALLDVFDGLGGGTKAGGKADRP